MIPKLEAVLRFLYRKLQLTCSGSFTLRRVFLGAVLLYMLFLRLDPGWTESYLFVSFITGFAEVQVGMKSSSSVPAALPSSFMWISKLLQLIKQMWRAMFAPYYQAVTQSKGL